MVPIEVGRLLRAGTTGFVVGCRANQITTPSLGALVRVSLEPGNHIYGVIYDIHVDDDGLVRQLVTAEGVSEAVIADNRENRNLPIEISVLSVGYQTDGTIRHLLPPRPPLSLDTIYLCDEDEICQFTRTGNFGYFRHILRAKDIPVEEILAAHLEGTHPIQERNGNPDWVSEAIQELITQLRDDYPRLISVLTTMREIPALNHPYPLP